MRLLSLILISLTPFNKLRIFLYRSIFNFKIDYESKIGMFNLINCKNVELNNAKIGFLNQIIVNNLKMEENSIIKKFNRIKQINNLTLSKESMILVKNFIGAPVKGYDLKDVEFNQQNISLGKKSYILRNNYFDVVRPIKIGDNVVFGGNGSEIWTHGFDSDRTFLCGSVEFRNNIFVGSRCIFTKNIIVNSNVSITSGSVVYKSIFEEGIYSSNKLTKIN